MPELPDVEILRRYLEFTSLHKMITGVEIFEPSLVEGTTVEDFRLSLRNKRMTDTVRRGKHLLVNLDGQLWLVLHFGMTGGLSYFRHSDPVPARVRILFSFDTGYRLAYTSQRNLGRVFLIASPRDFIRAREIGPDALSPRMNYPLFLQSIRKKKGMIKPALMDQSLIAGIGNLYSDEILFQAGINPAAHTASMEEEQIRRVYTSMKMVLQCAIEYGADPARMPAHCLLPVRSRSGRCPRCRSRLSVRKISGRSAVFCPLCQPASGVKADACLEPHAGQSCRGS